MKILLAIDSSAASKAAVSEVAARPWPKGTIVHILCAVESNVFMEIPPLIEKVTEIAYSSVKNAAVELQARGLETLETVERGRPQTVITQYAKDWGADFVIVGSQGLSALTRFLLGSVAQAVVRHAPCSVEVVRAGIADKLNTEDSGMKVLLAIDGSDCSIAAAQSVVQRPWPAGTEIKIVSAIDFAIPAAEPWYVDGDLMERLENEETEMMRAAALKVKKIITDAGLKASLAIPIGRAKAVIVDEANAWGADLIVIGSHGRQGVDRILLGSVSEAVAIHAHCSVEVIRDLAKPNQA